MAMPTSTDVVVRQAEGQELDAVGRLLREANAEFRRVLPAAFYGPYLANVLDVRSRLERSELFVAARSDGCIVGAVTLYPRASDEDWGWPAEWSGIRAVAVQPAARGQGLGRRLAERCVSRSRELGAEAVGLHTASFMGAAIRLYEGLGFRRVPAFDRDAVDLVGANSPAQAITALAYKLELGRS